MENAQNNFADTHQEKIIDFYKIYKIGQRRWYIFILSLAIALATVYVYLKYAIPVYSVSTKVFIKDKSSESLGSSGDIISGMNMFQPFRNLENEIFVMKSTSVVYKTIEQLNFDYSYFHMGSIKDVESYPNNFYYVVPDSLSPQFINTKIYLKPTSETTFSIWIEAATRANIYNILTEKVVEGITIKSESKTATYGVPITLGESKFTVYRDTTLSIPINTENGYYFIFNDKASLAREWRKIDVSQINKKASILQVSVKGANVDKIVDFANMLSRVYIQNGLDEKNQIASNTISFIDFQLRIIKDSLNVIENDLESFRSKNKVMNISSEAAVDYEALKSLESERAHLLIRQKYYQYLRDYTSAEKDYTALVVPSTLDINDVTLNRLIGELLTLANEKQALTKNNPSSNNPFVANLDSKIKYTKDALIENLNNLNKVSVITLKELDRNIASIQSSLGRLPVVEREFINIERKFNVNDEIYSYLLQKRAEASIAKASSTPDNKVIDMATKYDARKISPNVKSLYIAGIFLGLLIPIIITLVLYYLDNKIYTKEEVEEYTKVPFLGSVVHNEENDGKNVLDSPKSGLSESFRSIKVNIEFLNKQTTGLVIGVTSFVSGEGKTFVALNLASIYAIGGKKVVLVGMDLRKPRIDKEIFENKDAGLSNYLAGMRSIKDIIYPTALNENLFFIPSGVIPPNPSELLSSKRMDELLEYLKKNYDIIILDSPPVGLVVDYLNVVRNIDISLYIVRQGVTVKQSLYIIDDFYRAGNMKNLGIVLNDAKRDYKNYYSYGMGYYYGQDNGYYGYEESTRKSAWKKFKYKYITRKKKI
ncbi:GumC family protein [Cytophaga aurantiaca]|uniref:GumC family protein n=1 Tax=Cytophaga aurantiaca TaxID=29530 RepID=UPI000382337C|nr:tyrosine-protein kinase [Cytophaga aurantiaca]